MKEARRQGQYLGRKGIGERMNYITVIQERIQELNDNQEKILWYMQLREWEGKRRKKMRRKRRKQGKGDEVDVGAG